MTITKIAGRWGRTVAGLAALCCLALSPTARAEPLPALQPYGQAAHLMVDGRPFLIRGGELGNSSASDLDYLAPHWEAFQALHLNTVLAPVYWELLEPQEGRFDFALVDGLIAQARANDMRLVLLWFGSWKNSMSSYAPVWVKRDTDRFPRARSATGEAQEILSPFSSENLQADRRAFVALMRHLARVDAEARTVIMIQVENEIGMLPDARDHAPAATAAWAEAVPAELIAAVEAAPGAPAHALWRAAGGRTSGDWSAVFGTGKAAEEVFMAWSFACYVEAIASAGKTEYPLPMFVNAALNRPGAEPGGYPSAGPLPHLFEVWKAGAPSIDLLAPDIYFPNFVERISPFRRADNPLFIPEANQAGREEAVADALFAIGRLDAIGFSPFSIESIERPESHLLGKLYARLAGMDQLILAHQGQGTMTGLRPPVSNEGEVDAAAQTVDMGGYRFTFSFIDPWTPRDRQKVETHGGLLIQLAPDEFLVLGTGVTLTFAPASGQGRVGIESAWEGDYVDGVWTSRRLLNGDQTHQGRHVRLPPGEVGVQRVRLYAYD